VSRMADEISKGNLEVAAMPVSGRDEIAALSGSFNRMYLSLKKAIQMLENQ
jgi:HAMP domain-containing protein